MEEGGDNVMKLTPSMLLNVVLVAVLVSSVFFVNSTANRSNYETTSTHEYDPWIDLNDDGSIDLFDAIMLLKIYGTKGTPINKTELLLDLQSALDSLNGTLTSRIEGLEARVEALEAIISYLSIIPNGDFELDPTGTSFNDISNWNHSSEVVYGSGSYDENLEIVDDYYFNRYKSLYSYVKSNVGGDFQVAVSQLFWTENPVSTTSDYITLWVTGDDYTTSSRYSWWIGLYLIDGNSTHFEKLRCDCWGNNEGCTPNHFDYYNATQTGADGRTWKRYTRRIPDGIDKSNLTIKIEHRQGSWDHTSASSWYYLDTVYFSDANGNPVP